MLYRLTTRYLVRDVPFRKSLPVGLRISRQTSSAMETVAAPFRRSMINPFEFRW